MTKWTLPIAVAGLALAAHAEYQIDFDPLFLPEGHGYPRVFGDIGFQPGVNNYEAVVTGPSGFPEMYHAVWTNDDDILTPTPFNSMTLVFECIDHDESTILPIQPFTIFYIPGPANPPENPTTFGDFSTMDCIPDIPDATDDLPVAFSLDDAWPNPFNPATTLRFALPELAQADLVVYNLTGRKVATLVDDMLPRGVHEVTFDGSSLASGVYFCTLQAGSYTATRKVVLVK